MTETQTPRSNARSGSERIRGRQHGFDVEWSHERFAELIRHEVAARTDQRWPADRIWRDRSLSSSASLNTICRSDMPFSENS